MAIVVQFAQVINYFLYFTYRVKGEQNHNVLGDVGKRYMEVQEKIRNINQKIIKIHKEKEENLKDQMRSTETNLLRKNQINQLLHQQQKEQEKHERDVFKQTQAIVPQQIRSTMFFHGLVRVLLLETNELELRSEDHELKIEAKACNKIDVNCRQRLKKLNIPKRHQEINAQAYLKTEEKKGLIEIEQEMNVQTPMIHGILGEALMKSGSLIQLAKDLSDSIQKEPPLWIKWDPEGFLIKYVESENQEDSSVLCQILKEKDMNQIRNVLQTIRNKKLREKVLRLIIEIIETSYSYVKPEILCQLMTLLAECVNKNIVKKLQNECDVEDLPELQIYLKMIEKIIYRFYFNHKDNSLKYVYFNEDYEVVLFSLKAVLMLQSTSKIGLTQDLIELIYKVLMDQDNQFNEYDNSYMTSKLLQLIMHTQANFMTFKILGLLLIYLKKATVDSNSCILYKIIRHYHSFIQINQNKNDHFINEKFEIISNQILGIIDNYKDNIMDNKLTLAYYKAHIDHMFRQYTPYQFLMKVIFDLCQIRVNSLSYSYEFNLRLLYLKKFLVRNYHKFAQEQSNPNISLELQKSLAFTLWECLTQGPSLINPQIQHDFSIIYKVQANRSKLKQTVYYYFAPLCCVSSLRDKSNPAYNLMLIAFPIDQVWFTQELNQLIKETSKIKNFYGVQLKKRQRPTLQNQHFDTYVQLTKFAHKNPSRVNEREITKQILKFISQLPQIRDIEERMREADSVQQQNGTSFNFKYSLKLDQVKSHMKRKFEGMKTIQQQILQVINSYFEKGLVPQSHKDEYVQLINNFFADGRKVLEEIQIAMIGDTSNIQGGGFLVLNSIFIILDTLVKLPNQNFDPKHFKKTNKINIKFKANDQEDQSIEPSQVASPQRVRAKLTYKFQQFSVLNSEFFQEEEINPIANKITFKLPSFN